LGAVVVTIAENSRELEGYGARSVATTSRAASVQALRFAAIPWSHGPRRWCNEAPATTRIFSVCLLGESGSLDDARLLLVEATPKLSAGHPEALLTSIRREAGTAGVPSRGGGYVGACPLTLRRSVGGGQPLPRG
jgi:hypothetical protein